METQSCARCYANRECMVYRAAEIDHARRITTGEVVQDHPAHQDLLERFAGHLKPSHLQYFRDWDRMIDLEADASTSKLANDWLADAERREVETGDCISSLVFAGTVDDTAPRHVLLRFRRGSSNISTPLSNIGFLRGTFVVVATERPRMDDGKQRDRQSRRRIIRRHQHHTIRGVLESTSMDDLIIRAPAEDLERIERIVGARDDGSDDREPQLFRVDKETSSVGVGTLRQNIVNLLSGDYIPVSDKDREEFMPLLRHRLSRLRGAIIELDTPHFEDAPVVFPVARQTNNLRIPGCDMDELQIEYSQLNPDQQQAIRKAVSAKDYALIQGLPGTGKSHTISFLARLFAAQGKRVLITSYTHAAVDNVVLKLKDKGMGDASLRTKLPPLVRIGQKSSCHAEVTSLLATTLALSLDARSNSDLVNPSIESLHRVMTEARVVCISALSVPRSTLLKVGTFDVVIVDEAGQISQPAILGALMAADMFLLVGDHLQLPPLVTSEIAEHVGYGISMMKRLADAHPQSIAQLTLQYRMNSSICRLSSDAVYSGRLHCADETIASRKLELVGFPDRLPPAVKAWLPDVLDPNRPVLFVNTDAIQSSKSTADGSSLETRLGGRKHGSVVNHTEASIVRLLANGLMSVGLDASDIGIISPFRSQLRILEEDMQLAAAKTKGLELSTIDRYQGRDKQAIILSFVRSNDKGNVGRLLTDIRRLNVALTRAKSKMILVGSFSTLSSSSSDTLRQILLGMKDRKECYDLSPMNFHTSK